MNDQSDIAVLRGEISKTRAIVEDIYQFYTQVNSNEIRVLGKTRSTALIVAQIIENYYTCLETLFLRVSQFFENNLQQDKWHSDLLNKMTLRIDGVREPLLNDTTYKNLVEIMRFRHFKRYYFSLDYDWEKLDFVIRKFEKSYILIQNDLKSFDQFLQKLQAS